MGLIKLMNGDIIFYDDNHVKEELVREYLKVPPCCFVIFLKDEEKEENEQIYAFVRQCDNCANIVIAKDPVLKENRELYTFSIRIVDGCEIVEEKYPSIDINKHHHPTVKMQRIDLYITSQKNKYKVFTSHSIWRSILIKYMMKGNESIYDNMTENLKEALSEVYRYDVKFDRNGCICSWLNENKEGDLLYFIDYRLKPEVIEEIIKYIENIKT